MPDFITNSVLVWCRKVANLSVANRGEFNTATIGSCKSLLTCLCIAIATCSVGHAEDLPAEYTGPNEQSFRLIKPSHFEMGARDTRDFRKDHTDSNETDSRTIHPVILSRPFYVATTEVTIAQFRRFVEETGYVTTAQKTKRGIVGWDPVDDERGRMKSSFSADPKFTWQTPGFEQDDSHPVVGVSYRDAKAYCDWLSKDGDETFRLPTEAEWECVCRAGTKTYFSFGDNYRDAIHRNANVADVELERMSPGRGLLQWLFDPDSSNSDGFAFTSPAGSYDPNPWGLHDLHGNVWEWCEDRYLDTYYDQFKDPGRSQLRTRAIDPLCTDSWNDHGQWQVIRGGSWCVSPQQSRSAVRGVLDADDATCFVGFRVVRNAPAEALRVADALHQKSEASLAWLKVNAKEVREFHKGSVRLELSAESLSDEAFDALSSLSYDVDLIIRPPGKIDSETLSKFARIRSLTGFGIATYCVDVDEDTFSFLSNHTELQWLQVTGTQSLQDQDLFPHIRSTQLRSMVLQGDGITDDGLRQLEKQDQLEELHVGSTSCNGEAISHFAGSPLRDVSFQHLTDEGAAQLQKFPSLQLIGCRNCPITGAALKSFSQLRNLRMVQLNGCAELTDKDFVPLGKLYLLRQLNAEGTAAGDLTVRAFRDSVSLQDLRLGGAQLSDQGMAEICNIIPLRELSITKDATQITDGGFRDFWKLANLRTLNCDAPGVTARGFASLGELTNLSRLTMRRESSKVDEAALDALRERLPELNIQIR